MSDADTHLELAISFINHFDQSKLKCSSNVTYLSSNSVRNRSVLVKVFANHGGRNLGGIQQEIMSMWM